MGRTPETKSVRVESPAGSTTLEVETFTWGKLDYVDQVKNAFGL